MAIRSGIATFGLESSNRRTVLRSERRRRRRRRNSGCQTPSWRPLLRLLRLLRLYLTVRWPISVAGAFEERREEQQHRRGKNRREPPEAAPLCKRQYRRATAEERVVYSAGDLRADEHPDAVGDEHEESLRLAAHRRTRLLVYVDLPCHEEEIVTNTIAQHPRRHPDQQHALHTETHKHQRHEKHEDRLGHLTERHE